MPKLFKTIVERRDGLDSWWKDVRSYIVMADSVDEADKMTPCFEREFVRMVIPQDKSPYVYLLNDDRMHRHSREADLQVVDPDEF